MSGYSRADRNLKIEKFISVQSRPGRSKSFLVLASGENVMQERTYSYSYRRF